MKRLIGAPTACI